MSDFTFIKKITTVQNSIFYSFIHHNKEIIGFGRRSWRERNLVKIKIDASFNVIEDSQRPALRGEDPRCFQHNGRLYVVDNYLNDCFLIDVDTNIYFEINCYGKNFTFISHNGTLYLIDYIKPFSMFTFDIETGALQKVEVDDDENTLNYEYRGGTPGYKLSENEYYGYGHRTYHANDGVLTHDLFMWVVSFENEKPHITIIDVVQPPNSKNICDPTCVIEIDENKYLITAETDKGWFSEQDYITNVYQINF